MNTPTIDLFFFFLGLGWVLVFYFSVVLLGMSVRQRRGWSAVLSAAVLALNYGCVQCLLWRAHDDWGRLSSTIASGFCSLPKPLLASLLLSLILLELLLFRLQLRYEHGHLTPLSIKEAADSLRAGLCIFLPNGKILMANRTMEELCRAMTGEELISGTGFERHLYEGTQSPGCCRERVGDTLLLHLSDGRTWSVERHEEPYERTRAIRIIAADVTEAYQKTRELQHMQLQVTALNEHLSVYNRAIVDMTTQQEILNAKVKIHEELGSVLLSLKRAILYGAAPDELELLRQRLRQNIGFLRTAQTMAPARDEYELLLQTAAALGVSVRTTGTLPKDGGLRHIIVTAVHECITNTLRHAHGNELRVCCDEIARPDGPLLRTVLRNNGRQPEGEIRETGGLKSLRYMVETAGGTMTVRSVPDFSITVELPKEEKTYAL